MKIFYIYVLITVLSISLSTYITIQHNIKMRKKRRKPISVCQHQHITVVFEAEGKDNYVMCYDCGKILDNYKVIGIGSCSSGFKVEGK